MKGNARSGKFGNSGFGRLARSNLAREKFGIGRPAKSNLARDKLPTVPKGLVFDFTRTLFEPDRGRPVAGIKPLLKDAKAAGFRLFIYAKTGRHDPAHKLQQHGLNGFFEIVKLTDKKEPHEVGSIASAAGISPGRLLVIGDRVRTDIVSGKAAGAMTVWLKRGKFAGERPQGPGERPDITIRDVRELRRLLGLPAAASPRRPAGVNAGLQGRQRSKKGGRLAG